MTLQMALLEERMEGELQGEERGRNAERESVAVKMLRKGKSFEEIAEFIDLPIQRLKELAKDNLNRHEA